MNVDDLIGSWNEYILSPTGKSLKIYTERGWFHFLGIKTINLEPAMDLEQSDLDKEIYQVSTYKSLAKNYRVSQSSLENYGTTVEAGPPTLRARLTRESKELKGLLGFFIGGDYFSATLICREILVEKSGTELI